VDHPLGVTCSTHDQHSTLNIQQLFLDPTASANRTAAALVVTKTKAALETVLYWQAKTDGHAMFEDGATSMSSMHVSGMLHCSAQL
jgi:hypothetical protein